MPTHALGSSRDCPCSLESTLAQPKSQLSGQLSCCPGTNASAGLHWISSSFSLGTQGTSRAPPMGFCTLQVSLHPVTGTPRGLSIQSPPSLLLGTDAEGRLGKGRVSQRGHWQDTDASSPLPAVPQMSRRCLHRASAAQGTCPARRGLCRCIYSTGAAVTGMAGRQGFVRPKLTVVPKLSDSLRLCSAEVLSGRKTHELRMRGLRGAGI